MLQKTYEKANPVVYLSDYSCDTESEESESEKDEDEESKGE